MKFLQYLFYVSDTARGVIYGAFNSCLTVHLLYVTVYIYPLYEKVQNVGTPSA